MKFTGEDMRERGKIMKSVIRYEDMEGRTYATPAEAATADKIGDTK